MKFMGSKARIAKEILPIILKDRNNRPYVEPFVGGANLLDKVSGPRYKLGADINPYIISLFKALQKGWIPPTKLTEDEYYNIRGFPERYSEELYAFAAFCCSYGGKFWGGYARGKNCYNQPRNYAAEQARHLVCQARSLKDVTFVHSGYKSLYIPENSIIYCDPPYKGTTEYFDKFNHEEFYSWCMGKKAEGHSVFVSEYSMPEDFILLWEKKQTSSLTKNTGSKVGIERLFTL